MIAELMAGWCATPCSLLFIPLEARVDTWAVGPLVLVLASVVVLEWRRKAMAVEVELRWLRVLVCGLAGVLVLLGLAQIRQANHLSGRLERVEKSMPLTR